MSATSRYVKSNDGDLRLPVTFPVRSDDRYYTILSGDRIDRIAYEYLGDAKLWWVICDVNGILFGLDLPVGTTIRIPTRAYVDYVIAQ